jgi:uridine phosphorylase
MARCLGRWPAAAISRRRRRVLPGRTEREVVIPNYRDKYDAEAVFSPEEVVGMGGEGLPDVPPGVVLGYQPKLTEFVEPRADSPVQIVRSQCLYPVTETVGYVPVHEWGTGAPISAMVTENVIAAGAEAVMLLGGAAGLQPDVPAESAILPTDVIRDEGVSYHYIPDDKPVRPTGSLVDGLDAALSEAEFETRRGTTWTTSAFYRETVPEVKAYGDDGVVTLDMESAAVWAVCQYRGVDTASVHELGGLLTPEEWQPESESGRGVTEMFDPTLAGLETHVADT